MSFSLLLVAVFMFSACGEETVATAPNEFEANLMFDVLHSNGLKVDIVAPVEGSDVKTWEITIDDGLFGEGGKAAAIQILRDHGLPRLPQPEIKSSESFGIVSDREEKERQRRDLQIQIERQLYSLPDVISVTVIIAQPTDDIFDLEKTPTSASVSLVLKETQPKFTIEAVQTLVSGDVPKLKAENVKVLISQQTLREIPLEKLALKRRSNQIFAVGAGVVTLLALALGAVLYMSKRRRQPADADENEVGKLTDGDDDDDEIETYERPLLSDKNRGDDDEDDV